MVDGLAALPRAVDQQRQLLLHPFLPDELVERRRPQRDVELAVVRADDRGLDQAGRRPSSAHPLQRFLAAARRPRDRRPRRPLRAPLASCGREPERRAAPRARRRAGRSAIRSPSPPSGRAGRAPRAARPSCPTPGTTVRASTSPATTAAPQRIGRQRRQERQRDLRTDAASHRSADRTARARRSAAEAVQEHRVVAHDHAGVDPCASAGRAAAMPASTWAPARRSRRRRRRRTTRAPAFSTISPSRNEIIAPPHALRAAANRAPDQVRERRSPPRRPRRAASGTSRSPCTRMSAVRICALSALPDPGDRVLHLERTVLLDRQPGLGGDHHHHAGRPGHGHRARLVPFQATRSSATRRRVRAPRSPCASRSRRWRGAAPPRPWLGWRADHGVGPDDHGLPIASRDDREAEPRHAGVDPEHAGIEHLFVQSRVGGGPGQSPRTPRGRRQSEAMISSEMSKLA